MVSLRHTLSTILVGVLFTFMILFAVLLVTVLLASCRSAQSTVTTTHHDANTLMRTTAASLFSFNLADTLTFFEFQGDAIALTHTTATTPDTSQYPHCLVNPLPIARIIRHAAANAATNDTTATTTVNQVHQTTATKQPATSRFRDIAISCFLVVMFLGLVSCMFGVVTYMILKRM